MKGVTMYFPEGNDYTNKVKKAIRYFDSSLENEANRPYALAFDKQKFCADTELNDSTFWMILNYIEETYGYSDMVNKETIEHLQAGDHKVLMVRRGWVLDDNGWIYIGEEV